VLVRQVGQVVRQVEWLRRPLLPLERELFDRDNNQIC